MNKSIILGGGCFWCTEAVFKYVDGISKIIPGYIGGKTINPTYEQVCSGLTGHAEVIKINFDDRKVDLKKLLSIFFKTHNPTTLNRQGNDIGTQYRSVIFYNNNDEYIFFKTFIENLEKSNDFESKIVTSLEKMTKFFEAESYHHNYFEKNPLNGYCNMVIRPKINKFLDEKES